MLVILSVLLLTTVCSAVQPSIVSRFDSNEILFENLNLQTSLQTGELMFFPTIDPSIAEDSRLTTPQLITKYGYKAEVHHVTTDDGYVLEMHRMSGGKKYPPKKGKKVCFLQHGLLDSSASWVIAGPGHALGYILADEGLDVWFGNNRGNRYSLNHTTLNPFGTSKERSRYWSFSWHEIGVLDLPAMIDYVLAETEQTKLQYIGHSQGTTAFFVMTAQHPEYNHKIEMIHALAPVAFLSKVISPPIRVLTPFLSIIDKVTSLIGLDYITPNSEYLTLAGRTMCRDQAPTQILCENLLFLIAGYTSDQLNATLLPVILAHAPAGSATEQLIHYGQEVNSGHFRQYDYGRIGNLRRYKRFSPPDYDLKNIMAPVALYYSYDDWLADVKDTQRLMKVLPNIVHDYLVPHKKFNHIDFIWGIDAPFLLYDEIVRVIKSNNGNASNMDIDIRNSFEYFSCK